MPTFLSLLQSYQTVELKDGRDTNCRRIPDLFSQKDGVFEW